MNNQRLTLDDVRSEFLNVDLDLRSTVDLAPLLHAFGDKVMVLHADRIGRKHWLRLMLTRQPKHPTDGILRFAKLIARLPPRARAIWTQAAKELDIGFQGGLQPPSAEWLLEPDAVQAVARLGARIRFTLYSPQFVVDAESTASAQPTGTPPQLRSRPTTSPKRRPRRIV